MLLILLFFLKLSRNDDTHHLLEASSIDTKATAASNDSVISEDSFDLGTRSLRRILNVESPLSSSLENCPLPWIVGHRGCLYDELENTREGFQRAAKMGADAVELDVFLLRCGTLIVFHGGGTDENPGHLLDYCNVDKGILDLEYSEVLELSFNPSFAEFGCPSKKILGSQRIPTLEQVLVDAKQSGLHVKVELKGPGTVEPTLEVVERLDMVTQVSYASFDLARIAHLRKLRSDKKNYPTGALFNDIPDDFLDQANKAGVTEVHLRYDTCHKDIITLIHEAGMDSMAWFRGPIGMASDCRERFWDVGNEDESMYKAILRTGVRQLCVNRPDVLVQLRKKFLTVAAKERYELTTMLAGTEQAAMRCI